MITVKGFRYYDDYNRPTYTKEFLSMTEFEKWLQTAAVDKKKIHLPPQDTNGDYDQRWAGSFSGHLSFVDERRGHLPSVSCHVCTVEKDGMIIFSSGDYTGGKGHISSKMKETLSRLRAYINAEYNFAP